MERQILNWMYDGQFPSPTYKTFSIGIYRIVDGQIRKPPIYRLSGSTTNPDLVIETAKAIVDRLNTIERAVGDKEARIIARTVTVIARAHHHL